MLNHSAVVELVKEVLYATGRVGFFVDGFITSSGTVERRV